MQTQFKTEPFQEISGSVRHLECEKPEENNKDAKEYGKKVQLKMDR